ncbi:MAG: hypothetical protein QNL85_05605 [Euryarchaeota archaeon]
MKTKQINKNKPYYVAPGPIESMPNEPDVQKSRNEKYLKALQTLAEKDPEGFSNLAPELIKRSVWNLRGPDPYFSEKLENWFKIAYKWEDFGEILPKDAHITKRIEVDAPRKENLPVLQASFLSKLEQKFSGDHQRWDAPTRDQYIILGMLAMEGRSGVRQGKLAHFLGNGLDGVGGLPSSNAIRAAKIALSRHAKPLQLFAPAKGNGSERLHSFADENLADLVARFVLSKKASILLPPSMVHAR